MRTAVLCLVAGLLGPAIAHAQSPYVAMRIIAINDFHGHLEAGDNAVAVPNPRTRAARCHCAAAAPPISRPASHSFGRSTQRPSSCREGI